MAVKYVFVKVCQTKGREESAGQPDQDRRHTILSVHGAEHRHFAGVYAHYDPAAGRQR